MVSKQFDVVVKETGLGTIEQRLQGIASAAMKAQTSVSGLQAALNASSSAVNVANQATQAQNRQTQTTQKLTLEQKAYNAIVSQTTGALAKLTAEEQALNKALSSSVISTQHHAQAMADLQRRTQEVQSKMPGFSQSAKNAGATVGVARHELVNIGSQLSDIFVSLASGQNPFLVMTQQGAQIGEVFARSGSGIAGWGSAIARVGMGIISFLVNPITLLTASVAGGLVASFAAFTGAIQRSSDMGLSFGEVFSATLSTIGDGIHSMANSWLDWDNMVQGAQDAFSRWGDYVMSTMPDVANSIIENARKARVELSQLATTNYLAGQVQDIANKETLVKQGNNPLFKETQSGISAVESEMQKQSPNAIIQAEDARRIKQGVALKQQVEANSKLVDLMNEQLATNEKLQTVGLSRKKVSEAIIDIEKQTGVKPDQTIVDKYNAALNRGAVVGGESKFSEIFQENKFAIEANKAKKQKNYEALKTIEIQKIELENDKSGVVMSKEQVAILAQQRSELQKVSDMKKPTARSSSSKVIGDLTSEASEFSKFMSQTEQKIDAYKKLGAEQEIQLKVNQAVQSIESKKDSLTKRNIVVTDEHKDAIRRLIEQLNTQEKISKEVGKLYSENGGFLQDLTIQETAYKKALDEKIISETQYQQLVVEGKAKLAQYNIEKKSFTESDLQALDKQKYQSVYEKAYTDGLTKTRQELASLKAEEQAYQDLFKEGRISQTEYQSKMIEVMNSQRQIKYSQGQGSIEDALRGGLIGDTDPKNGGLQGLENSFKGFFGTLKTGFAESIGQALVYGESLTASLSKVAKQGVSSLISALIQLGQQWLITKAMGGLFGMGDSTGGQQEGDGGSILGGIGSFLGMGGEANDNKTKAGNDQGVILHGGEQQGANPLMNFGEQASQSAEMAKGSFGDFFSSVSQGFTSTFGQATQQTAALGLSLEDIAMNALNSIVQALVQVGIQWLVMEVIGSTLAASTAATTAVTAGTVATAWAPAAALASLATLGTNAVPAGAAIMSTTALSMAVSALGAFEKGGYTGNMGTKDVAGVVHGQEFVVNAQATARNRPILEAMNSGRSVSGGGSSGGGGFGFGGAKIEVHNYGSSKIAVEQISPDHIRIIAREEANNAVKTQTPRLVAKEISNPNSPASKALGRNTKTQRKL